VNWSCGHWCEQRELSLEKRGGWSTGFSCGSAVPVFSLLDPPITVAADNSNPSRREGLAGLLVVLGNYGGIAVPSLLIGDMTWLFLEARAVRKA
jgi:hypothetical protein